MLGFSPISSAPLSDTGGVQIEAAGENALLLDQQAAGTRDINPDAASSLVVSDEATANKDSRPTAEDSLALVDEATANRSGQRDASSELAVAHEANATRDLFATAESVLTLTQDGDGTGPVIHLAESLLSLSQSVSFLVIRRSGRCSDRETHVFKLQAPYPSLQTTSLLPNPQFSDGESHTSEVNRKYATNGKLRTYVKRKNGRKRLTWEFIVTRPKAKELMAFMKVYYASKILATDHNGRQWVGNIMNDPFEITNDSRGAPAFTVLRGELSSVRMEFEGIEL